MGLLKVPEDQPIEAKMISGAIEGAQSKIEGAGVFDGIFLVGIISALLAGF